MTKVVPILRGVETKEGVVVVGEQPPVPEPEDTRHCSFCGRHRLMCKVIVWSEEGPGICDRCVATSIVQLFNSVLAYEQRY